MDKKELSNEILSLMEKYEGIFGSSFNIEDALSMNRGIPICKQMGVVSVVYEALKTAILNGKDVSNYTFTIIKPNVVKNGKVSEVIADIEKAGFKVLLASKIMLNTFEAEEFYEEHEGKPFYDELVEFMTSYPVYTMILEKENAVEEYRKLMGSLDEPDSLRGKYADSVGENAVHGSDSIESFKREAIMMGFFRFR